MKFLGTIQIVEDLQNAKGENCEQTHKNDFYELRIIRMF